MSPDGPFSNADIWRPALDKYGAVTHLTVALYDIDEQIACGPAPFSPLFSVFEKYASDPGIFLECARKCLSQSADQPEVVVIPSYGLAVVGTPLFLRGTIAGAAVAGYVLLDFLQASAIEGLARSAQIPFRVLSQIARQLQPVPQRRLVLYGELLQVLGDSILRENDRTRQCENVAARLEREKEALHKSEQALLEQTETLETFAQIAKVIAPEIDMRKLVQAITDVGAKVTGAQFGAFFFNQVNEQEKFQKPYAISGASLEDLAYLTSPPCTNLLERTFHDKGVIRIEDVRHDPEYGMMFQEQTHPDGLSLSSYLAAPVVARSGLLVGGLFFGHSQSGVFHERHERVLEGLAAQAAVGMDNAHLYEAAVQAQAKAEVADRTKDEFLAMVSHELRTPLSAILGWSHILTDGAATGETVSNASRIIQRNAKAQAQLIDDLLDMSRITSGKLRLDFEPIELMSVIEEARDLVLPMASAKQIDLRVRFDTDLAQVMGDADRLHQVVGNLLSNAIKFTSTGGWVEVRLQRSEPEMVITVTDNGKGIKTEFLPYLFDRFVQGDMTITRRYSGLGLGLTIVRHLVELHRGTVTAESEGEGQGAKFTVRLPIPALRLAAVVAP